MRGEDRIRDHIEDMHPADLADVLRDIPVRDTSRILSLLPVTDQAAVFEHMDIGAQVELARFLKRSELARIITEMAGDDRTDLFNKLSPDEQRTLMPALSQAEREDIRRLSAYPEGTAGAIMTSDYALLSPDLTAEEALKKLRLEAPDKETIYRSYVVDKERRLLGAVSLKSLIIADPDTPIEDIMDGNSPFLLVTDTQEDVAKQIAKYDTLALPVLDDEERLVGIVTHDDAMDVIEQEATEDFHKMAAAGKLITSVRDATIAVLYRQRVTWLLLLVFVNIFTGAGIAFYEDVIAAHLALLFFLPLLIASSGNAGSQSATLMIRAMATGDVEMKDWGSLLGREFFVSLIIGLTMAFAVAFLGLFRGGYEIALVVAFSMCAVIIVGSVIGMSLPFLMAKFKMDPAAASTPLVTSIADVLGVLIYLGIASAILDMPSLPVE
ncbi:MAG: magnesium transporter [Micavibrio sp.]|nr:MAG: magnesium transporter [Micavibrio sp.]